jgi:hypothetical protein
LLWHLPKEYEQPSFRPRGYQAPSWSWAAINRLIKFIKTSQKFEELVSFNGSAVELKGQDKFGEVKRTSVDLFGALMPAARYQQFRQISDSNAGYVSLLRIGESDVYLEPNFDSWKDGRFESYYCVPFGRDSRNMMR